MSNKATSFYFAALTLGYPVYIAAVGHSIDLTNSAIEIGFIAVTGFYYLKAQRGDNE